MSEHETTFLVARVADLERQVSDLHRRIFRLESDAGIHGPAYQFTGPLPAYSPVSIQITTESKATGRLTMEKP